MNILSDTNSHTNANLILDDKISNNILNNSLVNINNIIQKVLEENRKNSNVNQNDKLIKNNENITKNNENNNKNNYYSNVHIKQITNINEVISNNINNNSNDTSSNNINNKNKRSLTMKEKIKGNNKAKLKEKIISNINNSLDNLNNTNTNNDSSNLNGNNNKKEKNKSNTLYNQFVKNTTTFKKKKLNLSSKMVSAEYNKTLSLTERKRNTKTFIINKKIEKIEKKEKGNNSVVNNIDMKEQKEQKEQKEVKEVKEQKELKVKTSKNSPIKKEPHIRLSIKDYIKQVKNALFSNTKKSTTKKENNGITMDEIKENNDKENEENLKTIKVHFGKKSKIRNSHAINSIGLGLTAPVISSKNIRYSVPIKEEVINELNNTEKNTNIQQNVPQNITNFNINQFSRKSRTSSRKNTLIKKKLSGKEKSFYILAKSPILRLSERLFFGRSTQNIREMLSISDILNINEKYLNNKKKELEEKLVECNRKIGSTFTASKTAEIAFNFIRTKDEEEFKQFIPSEKEKNEYFIYNKLLYLLLDLNYENIELNTLNIKLYSLINEKGFESIKDYLYHIYIKKKEKVDIVYKIDKINALLKKCPNLINSKYDDKFCRFVLFTSFLFGELIQYANDIKNTVELNIKTKKFIDIINKKIESYKKNKLLLSLKAKKA